MQENILIFLDFQVQDLKQSLEQQRKELNGCRSEITALKMHIEGSRSGRNFLANDVDHVQSQPLEKYKEEIKSLQMEIESLKAKSMNAPDSVYSVKSENEFAQTEEKVVEILEDKSIISHPVDAGVVDHNLSELLATQNVNDKTDKPEEISQELLMSHLNDDNTSENIENVSKQNGEPLSEESRLLKSENLSGEAVSDNMASTFYFCLGKYNSLHRNLPEAFSSAGGWDGVLTEATLWWYINVLYGGFH